MSKSRNIFEVLFGKVNDFYENIFYNYGVILSKHYKAIITGAVVCNILLALCIFKMRLLNDVDELYFLVDSRAKYDERYLKGLFNESIELESKYFIHQILDLGTWAEVIFHVAADADANILEPKYFDEIRTIHETLMRNTIVTDEKNKSLSYSDLPTKALAF
jgi:hypothetical protein